MRKRFKYAVLGLAVAVASGLSGLIIYNAKSLTADCANAVQNAQSTVVTADDGVNTVTAEVCVGGQIVPTEASAVKNQTVTANLYAEKGYRLKRVYANGVALNFTETSDFCYSVKALMPDRALVFTAEFIENPVVTDEYSFALEAARSQSISRTAISYWKVSYTQTGILFNVLVKDTNVVQNGRLAVEDRDFVEMRVALKTTEQGLENANALRCMVTADGTFALQKCLGNNDYAPSGYGLGYQYGENFDTDSVICTLSKNGFEGYAVTAYLSYELFGLTAQEAVGNMTFAPALNNSLGTDGAKGVYGVVWNSTDIKPNVANMESFLTSGTCSYGNPATWLGVEEDGTLVNRYTEAYKATEYVFVGDELFLTAGFDAFVKSLSAEKACNLAIKGATAKAFATEESISAVAAFKPQNVVLCLGTEDLRGGASAYTTAGRIISLLQAYRTALPETKFHFTALLPNATSMLSADAYTVVNERVTAYANSTEWLTVLQITEAMTKDGAFKPYFYKNGDLTAEGNDAFVGQIAAGLALGETASATFGVAEYGYTSVGWTESDGQTILSGRTGNARKYAYFKGSAVESFTASASFFATDLTGSVASPQFGMTVASETQRLYFYIQETYSEGEIVQKQLCYQLEENGLVIDSGALAIGLYYTDGASVKLAVTKTQTGFALYVGNYKAFTLTCAMGKASVGIYTQGRVIGVAAAEIQTGGV